MLADKLSAILAALTPPTITRVEIESDAVRKAISALPGWGKGLERRELDSTYFTCSEADFRKIVAKFPNENTEYQPDRFDCENFAFSFWNWAAGKLGVNCVGIVIDDEDGWGAHAYNLVILDDGVAHVFEPYKFFRRYDGALFQEVNTMGLYQLERGLILL